MDATPKKSTSEIGAIAELSVATALTRAGYGVFVPFFNAHSRIDLIYETPGGLFRRVQCKSARLRTDVITFYTCSHTGGVQRTYVGDADEFGVYCEATASVYLVPVQDMPSRYACLRVGPPRNHQVRGIRWAEQYLLGPP